MKRLVLLLLTLLPATLHAQTVNFRAGGSLAKLSAVQQAIAQESLTGFTGGASIDIPAGPVAFRIGGSWVRKGSEATVTLEGENVTVGLDVKYVEVPVLLLIGSDGRHDGTKAFLAVGASAGVQASCELRALGVTVDCEPGDLERYDVSAVAGAGITVPLTFSLNFGMEVLYLHGVWGIDEDDTTTRTFLGTAGFGIPLR